MDTSQKARAKFFLMPALAVGLLLVGWGVDDVGGFCTHPARAGLMVSILLSLVLFLVLRLDAKPLRRGTRPVGRQRWVLALFAGISLVLWWFLPYGDRRGIWVLPDAELMRYTGLILVVIGSSIRFSGLRSLGRQFSGFVTLQENHRLVQTGIYRLIRHPMYLGAILAWPGLVMVFRSWLTIPIFLLATVFIFMRMRQEEKLLGKHFGEDFATYRRRTWRLLPYLY